MPDDGWVLGVDEHTGCVLDLDAGTATVVGNGVLTLRRRGPRPWSNQVKRCRSERYASWH